MGWNFQISLECGKDDLVLSSCRRVLEGLVSENEGTFISSSTDDDGNRWISLSLDESKINEADWQQLLSGLWTKSLMHLPFRFAFAGLEVDQVRTYSELAQDPDLQPFEHVAISMEMMSSIGFAGEFQRIGDKFVR